MSDTAALIKYHPAALLKDFVVTMTGSLCSVSALAITHNAPSASPNYQPDCPSYLNATTYALYGMPEAEAMAAIALYLYIHEAGEHFKVRGVNINQHYAHGVENTVQLLLKRVIPWLRQQSDGASLPEAPDDFDPLAYKEQP